VVDDWVVTLFFVETIFWSVMKRFDRSAFHDAVEEYIYRIQQAHPTMPVEKYDSMIHETQFNSGHHLNDLFDEFGISSQKKVSGQSNSQELVFGQFDADEEEIEKALKMYRSVKNKSGRPSKVEKWESRILDGSATLDDARDEMSKNTWYKLKKRVEE